MKKIKVSDHAMVRYMERIIEHDFKKQLSKKILTPENINKIKIGSGNVIFKVDNFRVVVKDYKIATILKLNNKYY